VKTLGIFLLLSACILLPACTAIPARYAAIIPLNYDSSPENIVIYADVQPTPAGGFGPGKECPLEYRLHLRIWGMAWFI
jgi:hypothetical protein